MSRNILFISVDTIKDRTGLHVNVDPKLVFPDILYAQDAYILPALGTALYERLQNGIECGDLNCDEETLLNTYITPCLVYYVMSELPMALSYQFYNKGVVRKTGDNQTEPSASDLAFSAVNTDKGGKNSCNGGSSRRTVTGNPDIAIMMPTKSAR